MPIARQTHDDNTRIVTLPEGEVTISDPGEHSIYDRMVAAIRRVVHPTVRLVWAAIRRDDQQVCIVVDDGLGEAFYALQPGTDGWELVDLRDDEFPLYASKSCLSLALSVVVNVATIFAPLMEHDDASLCATG